MMKTHARIAAILSLSLLCGLGCRVVWARDAPPKGASVTVAGDRLSSGKAESSEQKLNVFGMRREIKERGFVNIYIQFAFNSAAVLPESRPQIEGIDALLREEPSWCLRIVGHADATGDPAYNRELSGERAETVRRLLLDSGIEEKRLVAEGRGADQPIADNGTSEGRARNRRVELVKMDCPWNPPIACSFYPFVLNRNSSIW
jgi:outer membrane protein OmpA-like peptidoglycan-associated protein